MTEVLLVASGIVIGLLIGAAFGYLRGATLAARRKAVAGAAAGFARVGLENLPTRSAADIIAGRIVVVLGGFPYVLRVLPRNESREWLGKLDARFASLANALDEAADDKPQILQLLSGHSDWMLELLRAYDVDGILPEPAYVDEYATDAEVLVATVEVWRAANPSLAILAERMAEPMTDGTTPEQPSSSPANTAGARSTSTAS